MRVIAKTLRDLIIHFSMKVKCEGVKFLKILKSRWIKCTLVPNVLYDDRRTTPTATERYEF